MSLELIDAYLNGPRTLSNDRLSFLIVSRSLGSDASLPTPPQSPTLSNVLLQSADEPENDYEWFMCAAHFIGDGMALHTFANDFFELLGSMRSQEDLQELVAEEWQQRWGKPVPDGVSILACYSRLLSLTASLAFDVYFEPYYTAFATGPGSSRQSRDAPARNAG